LIHWVSRRRQSAVSHSMVFHLYYQVYVQVGDICDSQEPANHLLACQISMAVLDVDSRSH
jgi:hypothetical protein